MSAIDPIKVYDARWQAAEFSDPQIRRLFAATAIYAGEIGVDTITLARDARLAAGHVLELAVEEFLAAGFHVLLRDDPISTPQSYFHTHHVTADHAATMGLTITASHNPAEYVGVKFVVPPVSAIGLDCGKLGGLTRVREIYHSAAQPPRKSGRLELVDLSREYQAFSLAAAGVSRGALAGMKVVLDAFNGSCGPEMFAALTAAGAGVLHRRLVPDGSFPTGSPNPTSAGKMDAAVALAKEQKAHAVIGIDGDGDRIVFGDAGGILTAGVAFVPVLAACLAGQPRGARALYDPKVAPLALAEWSRLGATPVLFRNGHSQIKDYMATHGILAAAEESGHYYHRLTYRDVTIAGENSIVTTLLFLKSLHSNPTLAGELWALQNRIATTGEFNYQFADDATRDRALAAIVAACRFEGAKIATTTADGIDLQGTCVARGLSEKAGVLTLSDEGYSGYIRVATNEKGVVRSYFSAASKAARDRIEGIARRILERDFSGKVVE